MGTYITNDTPNIRYVGDIAIPPGETREVPHHFAAPEPASPSPEERALAEALLGDGDIPPGGAVTEPNPASPNAPISEEAIALSALAVKDIIGRLDTQDERTLADLYFIETRSERPRKTLLGAITQEQLRRVNAAVEDHQDTNDERV